MQDNSTKIVWKKGFARLVNVVGILWILLILVVLLFQVWSCQPSLASLSVFCLTSSYYNEDGRIFIILDTVGLVPKPQQRCPTPVASDPDSIVVPKGRTPGDMVQNLSYFMEDEVSDNRSQIQCEFFKNGGAEMEQADI